jgi:phosphate transport system substrate-binding protein
MDLQPSATEHAAPHETAQAHTVINMTTPTNQLDAPPPRSDIDFSISLLAILTAAVAMIVACWLAWYFVWRPFPVDSNIPHYAKIENVSGNLVSVGSDTLAGVMVICSREFRAIYPAVNIQLEDKGSATAPPALLDGRSQLAPMSRPMAEVEVDAFEKRYGYKPTFYKVALDSLSVYVNKDNPIRKMTLKQADGIFSSTLKRGGPSLQTWGSLGLSEDWATKAITLYGRDSVSGTHDYFKQHVLQNGDFKTSVQEGISENVVDGVGDDPSGIGYSGIGWKTSKVRAVALGETAEAFVEPTYKHSLDGTYPLARFLYIYVNQRPGQPLDRLTREFIRYVLSYEGQQAVVEAKFFPLSAKIVADTLNSRN